MKKTVLVLCVIFITNTLSLREGKRVSAIETAASYARVVTKDAFLYADAGLSVKRFTLPESYFVKIVTAGAEYCRVNYMDGTMLPIIEGYVKTVDLLFVDEIPPSPYPEYKVTAEVDEVLFADAEKVQPKCVISRGSYADYIGEITIGGEKYLYVYFSGNVGYVRRSAFSDFELPAHKTYAENSVISLSAENSAAKTAQSEKGSALSGGDTAQVVIIALLIVGVMCLLFLLFRPERRSASPSAFTSDDD